EFRRVLFRSSNLALAGIPQRQRGVKIEQQRATPRRFIRLAVIGRDQVHGRVRRKVDLGKRRGRHHAVPWQERERVGQQNATAPHSTPCWWSPGPYRRPQTARPPSLAC